MSFPLFRLLVAFSVMSAKKTIGSRVAVVCWWSPVSENGVSHISKAGSGTDVLVFRFPQPAMHLRCPIVEKFGKQAPEEQMSQRPGTGVSAARALCALHEAIAQWKKWAEKFIVKSFVFSVRARGGTALGPRIAFNGEKKRNGPREQTSRRLPNASKEVDLLPRGAFLNSAPGKKKEKGSPGAVRRESGQIA